jgi:2-oxoglutarate ferredoxin oxidoreductase subunit delta
LPRIVIDPDLCKGCELCAKACAQKVLVMGLDINDKGYFYAQVAEPMRCLGCRLCCIACPDVAIQMHVHGTMVHYFSY